VTTDPKFTAPWHGIPRGEIDWHPLVDEDACIGCGMCVTGCKRSVYRFDFEAKKAVVAEPLNCMVGCMTCSNTCLVDAIHFPSLDALEELASLPSVHHTIEDDLLARRETLEIRRPQVSSGTIAQLEVAKIARFGERNLVVELRPHSEQDALREFTPGQYLELWIPDTDLLSRAYSIGSTPREDGAIVVDLRRVEEGRFSDYAFQRMQVGDVIQARGPLGSFRVTSATDTPLVFVARGTGFAPVRAMIGEQLRLAPARDIVLFWGVTESSDFYAFDELAVWCESDPNFQAVLTARQIDKDFRAPAGVSVEQGTVYDAVERSTLPLAGRDAYLAGPRKTMRLAVAALSNHGVDSERIVVDTYGG